ncbi:MAG: hypothetical protein QS721_11685 [Candidatus Endonucleobacter sp. (ex Gigantidas childressi)]|nr:hypothetical protein [Candidatus Endonucleobacter sp. (ex Gigantidas childressi)]
MDRTNTNGAPVQQSSITTDDSSGQRNTKIDQSGKFNGKSIKAEVSAEKKIGKDNVENSDDIKNDHTLFKRGVKTRKAVIRKPATKICSRNTDEKTREIGTQKNSGEINKRENLSTTSRSKEALSSSLQQADEDYAKDNDGSSQSGISRNTAMRQPVSRRRVNKTGEEATKLNTQKNNIEATKQQNPSLSGVEGSSLHGRHVKASGNSESHASQSPIMQPEKGLKDVMSDANPLEDEHISLLAEGKSQETQKISKNRNKAFFGVLGSAVYKKGLFFKDKITGVLSKPLMKPPKEMPEQVSKGSQENLPSLLKSKKANPESVAKALSGCGLDELKGLAGKKIPGKWMPVIMQRVSDIFEDYTLEDLKKIEGNDTPKVWMSCINGKLLKRKIEENSNDSKSEMFRKSGGAQSINLLAAGVKGGTLIKDVKNTRGLVVLEDVNALSGYIKQQLKNKYAIKGTTEQSYIEVFNKLQATEDKMLYIDILDGLHSFCNHTKEHPSETQTLSNLGITLLSLYGSDLTTEEILSVKSAGNMDDSKEAQDARAKNEIIIESFLENWPSAKAGMTLS